MRFQLLDLFPYLLLKKIQKFLDPCPELHDSSLLQAPFSQVSRVANREQKMPWLCICGLLLSHLYVVLFETTASVLDRHFFARKTYFH